MSPSMRTTTTTIPSLLLQLASHISSPVSSHPWLITRSISVACSSRPSTLSHPPSVQSTQQRFHIPTTLPSPGNSIKFRTFQTTSMTTSPIRSKSISFPTTTSPRISILSSLNHHHHHKVPPFHPSFFSTYPASLRSRTYSRSSSFSSGRSRESPYSSFRRRFDRIPPDYIVYGIIGINVGIFLLWQYATTSWQRFKDPSLYNWLYKNFIVSEMNLSAGRVYTLLTGCFSHSTSSHIFLNCLGLYFIAPSVVSLIGPTSFLALYLGGGIISSLVSLGWHRVVTGGRGPKRGSEGASGAIYASLAYYATIFPKQQFLLMFVLPVPAWLAVGGIFAYDLYSSIRSPYALTDSAGHIGGILAGVAFALASKGRGGFRGGPRVPWR